LYESALRHDARGAGRAELAGLLRYADYYARKRVARLRGREATDDFNARPVAATHKEMAR
jgi:hypothetical protein